MAASRWARGFRAAFFRVVMSLTGLLSLISGDRALTGALALPPERGGPPAALSGADLVGPPALRPLLAADTPVLAAIFVASIEGLTGDDYNEAQQEAWAGAADDEVAFGKRLSSELTLVATIEGSPVGFASLKGKDHIDLLYVHPGAVGQGVAAMLCDALEKLAGARGAPNLTVDASDNAAAFFAKRGYEAKQRNTVSFNGEWLANTTMQKPLGDSAGPGGPT
jgi:putative acetyltransferase